MQRRKVITAAAAASLTLLAGVAGMALSFNIVGADANDGVGDLSPVSAVPVPSDTTGLDTTGLYDRTQPDPAAGRTAPAQVTDSDHDDDDDHGEIEEHEVDDHTKVPDGHHDDDD